MKQLKRIVAYLLLPALFVATMSSASSEKVIVTNASGDVYVCTGPYAKKYHKVKTCKGLKNCSGEIKQISKEKAEADGKTACKLCYR